MKIGRLVACLVGSCLAAAAQAAEPSFAGKTVRIVVNQAAGGPTDAFLRNFTRFFEAHIPGHPAIIVDNGAFWAQPSKRRSAAAQIGEIGRRLGVCLDGSAGGQQVRQLNQRGRGAASAWRWPSSPRRPG